MIELARHDPGRFTANRICCWDAKRSVIRARVSNQFEIFLRRPSYPIRSLAYGSRDA